MMADTEGWQSRPLEGFQPVFSQPGDVTVRPARVDDGQFVARMLVAGFRSKIVWAVGEPRLPAVTEYLTELHKVQGGIYHHILIAEYGRRPAGVTFIKFKEDPKPSNVPNPCNFMSCWPACRFICMGCSLNEPTPERTCMVDVISVEEGQRGRGIGKRLMDEAEAEARRLGANRMMLYVTTDNRAKNLYLRQGYEIEDTVDGKCFTWCPFGVRHFYRMVKPLPQ